MPDFGIKVIQYSGFLVFERSTGFSLDTTTAQAFGQIAKELLLKKVETNEFVVDLNHGCKKNSSFRIETAVQSK